MLYVEVCFEGILSISSGVNGLLPIWYANPPFRMNHLAKRSMEFEWNPEYDSSSSKLLNLSLTYQTDGKYLIEVALCLWCSCHGYTNSMFKVCICCSVVAIK